MRNTRQLNKSQTSSSYINYSQTNNSLSKQTYSFSKSRRFQDHKTQCPLTSYNSEYMKKYNGFGMGIGKKYDFTKDLTCSPPSSIYLLKTDFDENRKSRKGFSLGPNRQTIKFANYFNSQVLKTPNSTHYSIKDEICISKSPSFSIRSRTKMLDRLMSIDSLNNYPGPGSINNPQIDRFGHKIMELRRNSGMISRSKRFKTIDNCIPGPASYGEIGKYTLSRNKARFNIKFAHGKRTSEFDFIAKTNKGIPGVGSYRFPSQFGQFNDGCNDNYGNEGDKLKNISVIKLNNRSKLIKQ